VILKDKKFDNLAWQGMLGIFRNNIDPVNFGLIIDEVLFDD
jgi:hypothetical protein